MEDQLDRLQSEHSATRAAIVVIDPSDGRILASLGRGPDGDLESLQVDSIGSTLKPLTVAAALDAGLDPDRRFSGQGGRWRPDAHTELRDLHARPSLSVQDTLIFSSNIGVGQMVEAMGPEPFATLFGEMGVEVQEPISWPARGAGIGVAMSPLNLATAYAALANGGLLIEPTGDGSGGSRRVLSESSTRAIRQMLTSAVGDAGTGRRARVEGQDVAGKTGSAPDGVALFAGFAPAADPRFVIVVRAEVPGDSWGGLVAAPVFSRIAAALLR